ncbi:MAG: hypothetical protein ACR2OG_05545 [Gemmatimonadaceae bacterium]
MKLFLAACLTVGAGAAAGSMSGHYFGHRGVRLGGILGGLLAAALVARIALGRQWIGRPAARATGIGAALGFLAAATVAIHTLSTPIGPVLSTLLIGAGAVLGASTGARTDGPR